MKAKEIRSMTIEEIESKLTESQDSSRSPRTNFLNKKSRNHWASQKIRIKSGIPEEISQD
jgi:hypothetical protein